METSKRKILCIVDFQYDFCNNAGSLYVKGSDVAKENIIKFINNNKDALSKVVFTLDWHKPNDVSFEKNGGRWPVHCVEYSKGASIDEGILDACLSNNIVVEFLRKGNVYDKEEYGAFGVYVSSNEHFLELTSESLDDIIQIDKNSEIYICGLAGDFCVKETLINLISNNNKYKCGWDIHILDDCISFIGAKENLTKYLI